MRRFLLLAILIIALISVSLANPEPAKCGGRCDVVKSLCMGQADMLNELCKATGGSTQACLSDFINYYTSCMTNNGCEAMLND